MPLPSPRIGEQKTDFIGRCMGVLKKEYPDRSQRLAVCMGQWHARGKNANELRVVHEQNRLMPNMSALIRREMFEGQEHLVCPVKLIKAGVVNGKLYTKDMLRKFANAWSDVPLPVWHPEKDGEWVSAKSPQIIQERSVGRVYNTRYEDGWLKGEAWINVEKCRRVSPDVIEMLENNEMIEVSTGLDAEEEVVTGVYGNKAYDGIIRDLRPDHLALLPRGKGACSVADGAGLPRVNQATQEGEEHGGMKEIVVNLDVGEVIGDNFDTLFRNGSRRLLALLQNELSHDSIRYQLQSALREALDIGEDVPLYIVDVFGDFVVFERSTAEGYELWRQGYSQGDDDQVELTGEAVEVVREVSYEPVTNEEGGEATAHGTTVHNANRGEGNMDKAKLVDALIANERTDWAEEDRETLMGMEDNVLSKMSPKPPQELKANESTETTETKETDEESETEETTEQNEEQKPLTADEYIANAPEGVREVLANQRKLYNEQKTGLIGKIMANKRNTFMKEVLAGKDLDELQGIVALMGGEPNFARPIDAGQGIQANEDDGEIGDMEPVFKPETK